VKNKTLNTATLIFIKQLNSYKMLFYLFITFQILYSISCNLSCYQAPFDINSFDYIVTPDHFPAELRNSSLKVNSVTCYSVVLWERNPDNTKIALVADIGMKAGSNEHQLQVDVSYDTQTSTIPAWAKQIIYQCSTDRCNSLSQLKHLLQALIVNESLHDLAYLLNPVKPFHGEWCYRSSNTTLNECNTTIPVSLCTQCVVSATMDQTGTELCATCWTADPDQALLVYEKTFNMTDRTNSSLWGISCARENCNTPAVSESILEKSSIEFNFTTFLNNETNV
jgi:hypothetical protein